MEQTEKKTKFRHWASYGFLIYGPDGGLRRVTLPAMFSPVELADKIPHHEIFYLIPPRHVLSGQWAGQQRIIKAGVVVWNRQTREWHYAGESLPTSEQEAEGMLRTAGLYRKS